MRRLLLCALLLLAGIWCLEQRADALTPTQQSVLLGGVPAPVLDCNFLTGSPGPLCPGFTFSRGSSATYYNSSGVLTTASSNAARYGYNPVTLAPNGLLIEGGRTNLITYSNGTFDGSPYASGRVTVTNNNVTSPDGTLDASTITETSTSNDHYVSYYNGGSGITVSSGATVTFPVFIKPGTRRYLVVGIFGSAGGNVCGIFDTTAGAVVNTYTGTSGSYVGTLNSTSVQQVSAGFYRVSVTGSVATATSYALDLLASNVSNPGSCDPTFTANGSTFVVWQWQAEVGTFPMSLIATTSSTVTRSADVGTATVASLPGLSLLVSAIPGVGIGAQTMVLDQLDDGTANNKITLVANTSAQLQCIVVSGGATQATLTLGTLTALTAFNSSCAMAQGVVSGSLNGVSTSASIATMPTGLVNQRFGANTTGNYWNGWIGRTRVFNKYLPQKTSANDAFIHPAHEVA